MKKRKFICLLARIFKQVIWKSSGYGIFIELLFYIETPLVSRSITSIISYSLCECHNIEANLLTFALVELK